MSDVWTVYVSSGKRRELDRERKKKLQQLQDVLLNGTHATCGVRDNLWCAATYVVCGNMWDASG